MTGNAFPRRATKEELSLRVEILTRKFRQEHVTDEEIKFVHEVEEREDTAFECERNNAWWQIVNEWAKEKRRAERLEEAEALLSEARQLLDASEPNAEITTKIDEYLELGRRP